MLLDLPTTLGMQPFQPRAPWLTSDLQTLRDSLRPVVLPPDTGSPLLIPVGGSDQLLALLDLPLPAPDPGVGAVAQPCQSVPLGLVLLLHGLGGSSEREGLRRLGLTLQHAGFAVLRLNMRGAGPGRNLARGTYAARCNSDVLPAIARARQLAAELGAGPGIGIGLGATGRSGPLPLLGMGISLGGTKLLNALLADADERRAAGLALQGPLLDGLVCISSPLDLEACSDQIDRPRNHVYRSWLLRRLLQQTLADPFGVSPAERAALEGRGPRGRLRSIRDFDAAITAPRWGYAHVEAYYRQSSPMHGLLAELQRLPTQNSEPERDPTAGGLDQPTPLPPTLIVHAADDPWVPVAASEQLARLVQSADADGMPAKPQPLQVLITAQGGHNGFHAQCDHHPAVPGNWGDRLTACWLRRLVGVAPEEVAPQRSGV